MEKDKRTQTGIGTKSTALEPVVVEVLSVRIETAKDKAGSVVGEKVVLTCQYPNREKPVELSQVKYLKGKTIEMSGLWFKLDEDKLIPKDSALSAFLKFYNVSNLDELEGQKIQTALGDRNFLVARAF